MKNIYTLGVKHVSKIHVNPSNSETCSLVCGPGIPQVVYIGVCVCCEEEGEAAEEDEDSEEGAG